jgi:hypothetical protein
MPSLRGGAHKVNFTWLGVQTILLDQDFGFFASFWLNLVPMRRTAVRPYARTS